jgi:hypothetical protein
LRLEDTEDLVTGDEAHLGNTMRVTEGNTDLGGSETLAGQFDDVLDDFIRRSLEPRRRGSLVGKSRGRWWIVLISKYQRRELATHKCPCRERAYDP